jgi:UDP-N-acetylglucosamine--N-acetylmuramyl-(pentapeptide) pyrophosphoryl-undecaprenol N-acetylglucosamine transferase
MTMPAPNTTHSASQGKRTAIVMAGGTGGHIFPGIAIAQELVQRGWAIEWIGTPTGMENTLVPQAGFHLNTIEVSGVRGKGTARWLAMPFMLWRACRQAAALLKVHQPHVVLGIGGYMSVPGGLVAKLVGRPLVVLEPGARAGLANRVLALLAKRTMVGFVDTFEKRIDHPLGKVLPLPNSVVHTGTPLRSALNSTAQPRDRFTGREGPLQILIVGGSLGAQSLNDLVVKAIASIPADKRPIVTHQAGQKNADALAASYREQGVEAKVLAFIDDMASAYAQCDVIICRAGAITVAELTAVGVASILIPLPWVVGDEQKGNALYLVNNLAGIMLEQQSTSPEALAQQLMSLTRTQLLAMAERARSMGKPQATQRCADVCEEIALPLEVRHAA